MRSTVLGLAVAAALAAPATALAANCAPPGVSGVDQYLETIPGSSCNAPFPATGGGGAGGAAGGSRLDPVTARGLQARGSAGVAVQRLVAEAGTAGALSRAGSPVPGAN